MRKCVVCGERPSLPERILCSRCLVGWNAREPNALEWAAQRARYYERRRAKRLAEIGRYP
ncbi:MAG TPA: hypothetical protein VGD74_06115 [Vulgatibacter sp.]